MFAHRHGGRPDRRVAGGAWLAMLSVALVLVAAPTAAPAQTIEASFSAATKGSSARVDHAAWDRLLREHLVRGADAIQRLHFAKLSAGARPALASYIKSMEAVNVAALDRPEQLAYWINIYNAVTLDAVLARYPVKSIMEVNLADEKGELASGPWKAKLVKVAGIALSLDDIENLIVRPVFKDPRAHYALNCLSIGCPNMRAGALTAGNLEAELEQASAEFVNHPRGITIADGKVVASSVYEWFADDFGGPAGVLAHLAKYAEPPLKARLATVKAIDGYGYDWALADASR